MKEKLWLSLIVILSLSSCQKTSTSIEDKLIDKCINAHGGIDKWDALRNTVYRKDITLFNSDGSVEKVISQKHKYTKTTALSGTIEWKDSIDRKITYSDGRAYKTNGLQTEEASQSALNTFNSAYYVLNMPWKLSDETAKITYLGLDTILENKTVHVLKVEYPSESQSDDWEYYLDEKEFFLVANMVHHEPTYSLITNDEYTMYEGLKFNAKRTSYRVDSLRNILYMRAKYEYVFD